MSHIVKPRASLRSRTDTRTLKPARRYKRQRYNKYSFLTEETKNIQQLLQNPGYGDCAYLAYHYKLPGSTLRTWKSKIKADPEYDIQSGYKRNRKAIFTVDEEKAIADFIRINIIEQNQYFTDQDFKIIAMNAYLEKYQNNDNPPKFNCSNGFVYDFKKRNNFSSRRTHLKRRPVVNDDDIRKWRRKIKNIMNTVPKDRIVNVDETAWLFYPRGLLTWANKGSSNVSISIEGSEKDNITVLCAITASGTKLPMMLIAAGKTTLVEDSQLGDVHPHWKCHSETGWTTEGTFIQYLEHLAEHFDYKEIHLILDVYAAHKTEAVKEAANALNIKLHFIPPGCTDLLQPLDVKVFGALKSTARRLFRERYSGVKAPKVTSKDAVQNLIKAWEGLSMHIGEAAWDIYKEEEEE